MCLCQDFDTFFSALYILAIISLSNTMYKTTFHMKVKSEHERLKAEMTRDE